MSCREHIIFVTVFVQSNMATSDSESAGVPPKPPAGAVEDVVDTKPGVDMLAFMEEMRQCIRRQEDRAGRQDMALAALQRAIMAAPAGGGDVSATTAADVTGAAAAAAAAAAAPAPAIRPLVGRGQTPCYPPRSHELVPYREDAAETMADFFSRFERCCTAEYRGTLDDALPLLRSNLSGRALDIFDANGPRGTYLVVKRRMLEWASRHRGYEESAMDLYQDATRRPGESLAVYAFRLAALFEDAHPGVDKQVSNDLRRKLLSTLPTEAVDFLRRQLRYAQITHDITLTWDGLVSYLECERFESSTGESQD